MPQPIPATPPENQLMRVLHVLDHSLPLMSGYSVRSHYLIRSQGLCSLTPMAVTSPKHGPDAAPTEIEGIRYLRTPQTRMFGRRVALADELMLMRSLAGRVAEIVRRERIDLVHAHSPVLNGLPALWAARRTGVPVVYEIRAFWEDAAVDQGKHREDSSRYRAIRALESWLMRRVDGVGVISAGLETEVIGRGIPRRKVFCVPNGVDTERFHPMARDDELAAHWGLQGKTVVAFIGSFYHFEGVDLLLEAFGRIAGELPELALVFIGAGEMLPRLRAEVARLDLSSRVVFVGSVPHEEIPRWYSICDVLAYPRRRMRLTDLVTPLKPLEAMASGRAVVASDVGGLRELVDGDTGVLFPAGDVSALAAALARLARSEETRRSLGEQARKFVCENREWRRLGPLYLAAYRAATEARA